MKTIAIIAAILGFAGSANAAMLHQDCLDRAATNYAIAVAIGNENADMVHEDTMVDCWESQLEAPMSYEVALEFAHETGACYVERSGNGWVVVQECDEVQ